MNAVNTTHPPATTYALWLFVIAAILIFLGLGIRDPWPADEPRFAQVAKEMVETGQWFFPARGGEYYPDKPPVFMWAIALFFAITGSIKIAFLLPSALCGLLTLFLVYDLAKRLWSKQEAVIAAAVLLFCFQFLLQAKSAQIDAMVSCWITIGCYGLLRFLLIERHWRWYYLAFFFMGIGVITKGVGFLPLLMLIPYYFYQRMQPQMSVSGNEHYVTFRWLAGPFIMLLAIALWFVPMLLLVEYSQDPALVQYRDNILFKQTVTRYADSWHHLKPFWYYIVEVIPVFWLPLSIALPWLIPGWYKSVRRADGRIILPLAWILLLLLFFSLSPGKRGVYILPALPMLALISAPYVTSLIHNKWLTWALWALVLLLSIGLLGFGIAGCAEASFAVKLENKFGISPWLFFSVIGALGGIVSAVTMRRRRWRAWPYFICLLWGGYSTWGYTLLEDVKTPKNVFQNIQAFVGEQEATIALVDFSEQFILFSPYPIVHFGYHTANEAQLSAAAEWLKTTGTNSYVLVDERHLTGACFDSDNAVPVGYAHRSNWVIVSSDAVTQGCTRPESDVKTYTYTPQ